MDALELKVTRYEVDEQGVALVTLNRPERMNAWTGRMELEYRWCMAAGDADPEVRAIVVTGAGQAFCAGADFAALGKVRADTPYDPGLDREQAAQPGGGVRPDFEHPCTFPFGLAKPVIAAINGPAAGIGFVLACFADIRFAAAGAKITTSFGRLNLPAEYGVSWILPRIVGSGRAADLLFSSRVVRAEEAERMGLVNAVFAAEDLLPETMAYARRMATEISPRALRAMKRQLYGDQLRSLDEAAAEAKEVMEAMIREPDFFEGAAAFQQKRQPRFSPLA